MKQTFLFLWMCIFCRAGLFAQAYLGETELHNTKQAVAAIRLPHSTGPVEDALKQYMMTKGYKSTGTGGFILFRSVPLEGQDTSLNDLYFKADAGSRKEKDITVLSLLPAKKNQDARALMADSVRLEKARLFLDSLAPFIDAYGTRLQLSSQQDALGKAQKKMNDLKSDQADLDKKIRNLQADLDQNQKDQVQAAADLQASINADDETKNKNQKKVRKLLDEEGSLDKRMRRAKLDLAQNKADQEKQEVEVSKQQQGLQAVKGRQSMR